MSLPSQRLDLVLVRRGLARSRGQACDLIRAGQVTVDGRSTTKISALVPESAQLEVVADPWVSRAAHKLLGALDEAQVEVPARVLDAGASTGGFTQVLLARGAQRVYAVDVGHDQLAPTLRADPRVVVREGLNLRDLVLDDVEGDPVGLVVADVSFISLRLLLAPLVSVLRPDGSALLLVKPQFEVGRGVLSSRGVVLSSEARAAAVDGVAETAAALGWVETWRGPSRLPGPAGTIEWFLLLQPEIQPPSCTCPDVS